MRRSQVLARRLPGMLVLAGTLQACGGGSSGPPSAATSPPAPPTSATSAGGLDERPVAVSCHAWDRPTGRDAITLEQVYADLPPGAIVAPVGLQQAPGDASRWFVIEQAGRVSVFEALPTVATAIPFIDIRPRVQSGGELGLLGMAFHPDFPVDPRVFLSYTTAGAPYVSRISSFVTPDRGLTLDPNSERILLTVDQPEANHNGGNIAFGPDGLLYIGFGDGGGGGDQHGPQGNGQSLTTLLGKMLRIDIGAADATSYAIPATNPFADNARCPAAGRSSGNCPEIYAWGFRNPWRWSFDRSTGELWVGDVGQGSWEEVDRVERGGNYGWRVREGAHCYGSTSCVSAGLIDPVVEYDHSLGSSITGGYVYRGPQSTTLQGRYLFGDFTSGRIWAWLPEEEAAARAPTELASSGLNIASFAEANDGELYVVDIGGSFHRIVFQARSVAADPVPARLSETGCVAASNPSQAATGLIPYGINAEFWSDGAAKERWLSLPAARSIAVAADGHWELPAGSVLMKHFRLGTRLVETRLLLHHPDGVWAGYTYAWNAAQTDADRVQGGRIDPSLVDATGAAQTWDYPSESQCLECHTAAAGRSLGLTTAQLNREQTYPQTSRTANQLTTFDALGLLTPPLADPASSSASREARARAYLDANCAQCHRPGGPTPSALDLRSTTALAAMGACDVAPSSGDLGIAQARLIVPGDPARSLVVARMGRRDAHGMPPLASERVDAAGLQLVGDWIEGLAGC